MEVREVSCDTTISHSWEWEHKVPLKQQSSCDPALSTGAGRALSKLTGQLLQSQGSRCGLDGKDVGPTHIILCSPLKAAWKVGSAVSTGSMPGGKSPA